MFCLIEIMWDVSADIACFRDVFFFPFEQAKNLRYIVSSEKKVVHFLIIPFAGCILCQTKSVKNSANIMSDIDM